MKKYVWAASVALAAVACLTACDDSSSTGNSNEIPSYKDKSALPDSCELEVAKVDTSYYACLEDKWIEVKDSVVIEKIKKGLDEEELEEELKKLLRKKSSSSKKPESSSSVTEGDEKEEFSSSSAEEGTDDSSSDSQKKEKNKGDSSSGSSGGSGSGEGGSGSGSTTEEVKCVEKGFSALDDYVKWTSSSEGNKTLYGKKALVKKCVGDAKGEETALKNDLQHDTRYQCFTVASLTDGNEEIYESASAVFDVEVKVGDFVCEGMLSGSAFAITLLNTETGSSKFYAASADMSAVSEESSSSGTVVEESSASTEEGEPCGDTTYDPATQYCAGGTTPTDLASCGDDSYNPEVYYCSKKNVVAELLACGKDLYNPEVNYCKAGELKSIVISASRTNIFVKGDTTYTTLTVEDATSCTFSKSATSATVLKEDGACSWTLTNTNTTTNDVRVTVRLNSVDFGNGAVEPSISKNIIAFGKNYGRSSEFAFLDTLVEWYSYYQISTRAHYSKAYKKAEGSSCEDLISAVKTSLDNGYEESVQNPKKKLYTKYSKQTEYVIIFLDDGYNCSVTARISLQGRI